ncbi:hypothetical protein PF003_g21702 [Phytophthora fragariae]|nr:hypothetical protein PF003_g21702 [Phytophthora fragariae]
MAHMAPATACSAWRTTLWLCYSSSSHQSCGPRLLLRATPITVNPSLNGHGRYVRNSGGMVVTLKNLAKSAAG